MGVFERGVNSGFPAVKSRWETSLYSICSAAMLVLAFAGLVSAQQPGAGKTAPAVRAATSTPKPDAQKHPSWRVKITRANGAPYISVHAKKASLAEVAADLGRQLKIEVVLTDKAKQQQLTKDFEDLSLEGAVKQLSPHAIIDYVVSGGADRASEKKALAVYLLGPEEQAPDVPSWLLKDPSTTMFVGMVYTNEDEEKAALEVRKRDLQVSYNGSLFTLHIHDQFLTDVLEEIAARAGISFAILTSNKEQKEIDQKVSWDIAAVNLEELTNTWFPSGIRLYCRTDLENDVSKPLRLTIESNQDAQAEQNVTP